MNTLHCSIPFHTVPFMRVWEVGILHQLFPHGVGFLIPWTVSSTAWGQGQAFAWWLVDTIPGGGGSEAKKKFVYLKSTSKFGPL